MCDPFLPGSSSGSPCPSSTDGPAKKSMEKNCQNLPPTSPPHPADTTFFLPPNFPLSPTPLPSILPMEVLPRPPFPPLTSQDREGSENCGCHLQCLRRTVTRFAQGWKVRGTKRRRDAFADNPRRRDDPSMPKKGRPCTFIFILIFYPLSSRKTENAAHVENCRKALHSTETDQLLQTSD